MKRLDPDERRALILKAARNLFSSRPYEEISSADLARAAGISRGLLNHYFRTKRDLYLAVVEDLLRVPPIRVPEYVEGATVRDRVTESVSGWLELLERNPRTWLTAVGIGGPGEDRGLEAVLDEARERVVDLIVEIGGLGPAARTHPEVRAVLRGYSGLAEAASREWLARGRMTREQTRVLLVESLVRILDDVLPKVIEVR